MAPVKNMGRAVMEWEEEELQYLRDNYRHGNCQAVADKLGRGLRGVQCKAKRLGITRDQKTWTRVEEDLLRKIYPVQQVGDTCKQLGRTRMSVSSRARKLGIKLDYEVYCESKPRHGSV